MIFLSWGSDSVSKKQSWPRQIAWYVQVQAGLALLLDAHFPVAGMPSCIEAPLWHGCETRLKLLQEEKNWQGRKSQNSRIVTDLHSDNLRACYMAVHSGIMGCWDSVPLKLQKSLALQGIRKKQLVRQMKQQ